MPAVRATKGKGEKKRLQGRLFSSIAMTDTFSQRVSGRVGGLEEILNEVQRGQGLAEDEPEGANTTSERLTKQTLVM